MNLVVLHLLEDLETKEMQDFQDDLGVQDRMASQDQLGLKEQLVSLELVCLDLQALRVIQDMMGSLAGLVNRDFKGLMELLGFRV